MFPRLVVFDFHKTISLDKRDINSLLKKYKEEYRKNVQPTGPLNEESWYTILSRNNISLDTIIPTWKDIKYFITYISDRRKDVIFAIASMIEQDSLILGMMRYAFEKMNLSNPFNTNTVVASSTFNKYGFMNLPGKQQHITVITMNLGLQDDILIKDTVLIDDNIENLIKTQPICGVLASNYFRISDWNNAQTNAQTVTQTVTQTNTSLLCNYSIIY